MIDPRNPAAIGFFNLKIATPAYLSSYFETFQMQRCTNVYADSSPEVVGGEQWRTLGNGQTLSDICPIFCSGVEATGLYGKNPTLDANNMTIFTGNSYCEQNMGGTVYAQDRTDEFFYLDGVGL